MKATVPMHIISKMLAALRARRMWYFLRILLGSYSLFSRDNFSSALVSTNINSAFARLLSLVNIKIMPVNIKKIVNMRVAEFVGDRSPYPTPEKVTVVKYTLSNTVHSS
jgi:hypothetical protein